MIGQDVPKTTLQEIPNNGGEGHVLPSSLDVVLHPPLPRSSIPLDQGPHTPLGSSAALTPRPGEVTGRLRGSEGAG